MLVEQDGKLVGVFTDREVLNQVALEQDQFDRPVREVMTTSIAGEMTPREPHDGYLVFQGGTPEVRDFLGRIWS